MSGRIVSVDEAIRLLTEYKKNGGENVLFSSFDLDTRSPDCEAIQISVTCGIKAITTGFPITYNKNFIMSTLISIAICIASLHKTQTNVLESIDTNKCLVYDINIFTRIKKVRILSRCGNTI